MTLNTFSDQVIVSFALPLEVSSLPGPARRLPAAQHVSPSPGSPFGGKSLPCLFETARFSASGVFPSHLVVASSWIRTSAWLSSGPNDAVFLSLPSIMIWVQELVSTSTLLEFDRSVAGHCVGRCVRCRPTVDRSVGGYRHVLRLGWPSADTSGCRPTAVRNVGCVSAWIETRVAVGRHVGLPTDRRSAEMSVVCQHELKLGLLSAPTRRLPTDRRIEVPVGYQHVLGKLSADA